VTGRLNLERWCGDNLAGAWSDGSEAVLHMVTGEVRRLEGQPARGKRKVFNA
jgi:hypothetical protein